MAIDRLKLIRKITDELNEEIGVPTIFIYPNKRKKVSLTGSKFGGLPYWDNSQPYPTDKKGNKLKLLAQFNLSEVSNACHSDIGLLPDKGILQFFLLSDDDYLYGSDLDDYTNDNHFRVIYHPSINKNVTIGDVVKLNIPVADASANDYEPITGEIGLDFDIQKRASAEYGDFKEMFIKKAASYGWQIENNADNTGDLYDCLDSDAGDELFECAFNEENCLLGYPVFVQSDPRFDEERYAKYDTQLFQMVGSDEGDETEFMSIWGDMGIAHFFINRNKLIEKDFTDILYYWDCS